MIVLGIHRPHSGTAEGFIFELNKLLNNELFKNKNIELVGDLNIDLSNESHSKNIFMNFMFSMHFVPVITKPTRFSVNDNHKNSLLDQIWINNLVDYTSGIIITDITDHFPVFLMLPISSSKSEKFKITFRDQSENNFKNFENALKQFDWSSIFSESVDEHTQNFCNSFHDLFCEYFPLKTKFISQKQSLKPWITADAIELIKYKSQYHRLYLMGLVSKSENNYFKNKVKSILEKLKKSYYVNLFERNKFDIKSTWKTINKISSRQNNIAPISNITWKNCEYSEEPLIAEIFNEYFSSVAKNLDIKLVPNFYDPL